MSIDLLVSQVGAVAVSSMITKMMTPSPDYSKCFHKHFIFSPEYTSQIDTILCDPKYGNVGTKHFVAGTWIPAEGVHMFRVPGVRDNCLYINNWTPSLLVTFKKVRLQKMKDPDTKNLYYLAWVDPLPYGQQSLDYLEELLVSVPKDTVCCTSIDSTCFPPGVVNLPKICFDAKPHQKTVVDRIVDDFNKGQHNVGTIICGSRGLGKSYIGMLVKRQLDMKKGRSCLLFDDFDPTKAGVNIIKLALNHAKESCPVIVLINEIDTVYATALKDKPSCSLYSAHADSKLTFNNMLDAIRAVPYVIMIGTTEKSHAELTKDQTEKSHAELKKDQTDKDSWASFVRPGRVDFFVTMTKSGDTIESKFESTK